MTARPHAMRAVFAEDETTAGPALQDVPAPHWKCRRRGSCLMSRTLSMSGLNACASAPVATDITGIDAERVLASAPEGGSVAAVQVGSSMIVARRSSWGKCRLT